MEYQWNLYNLLGGLEHFFYDFPYIGNVIIPTDELDDFFKGVGQPPTSWGLLGIVGYCWVLHWSHSEKGTAEDFEHCSHKESQKVDGGWWLSPAETWLEQP